MDAETNKKLRITVRVGHGTWCAASNREVITVNEDQIKVAPSERDKAYWLAKDYAPPELRSATKVDLLLVPQEGFGDYDGPVFPVGTEELLQFLQENLPADKKVDVCITDDDYRELALHADLAILATICVTSLVAPVAVNLISEYLKRRMFARKEETEVRLRLLVDESDQGRKRTIELSYEGPATQLEDTIMKKLPATSPLREDEGNG